MTTLTFTHLHITARATTDVRLAGHLAGSNLRNALANVIRFTTCPETSNQRREPPSPAHIATCPACWLLSAEIDPGSVVRAYAVIPPLPAREWVRAGDCFSFGLTLFGDGGRYLPYFVLAINEVGRVGVGPGRGNFTLEAIHAFDPLQGDQEQLLAPGEFLVRLPETAVGWSAVPHLVETTRDALGDQPGAPLTLHFHTPLRLEEKGHLFKSPDFGVFFRRLLYRIDDLGRQFAGQPRRDRDEVAALHQLADQVRLVESRVRWHELWSYSGRKQSDTPLSGLTGRATYTAPDWRPLLPWLIFGQGVQVGKSAVRGNGLFTIAHILPDYWSWLRAAPPELSPV